MGWAKEMMMEYEERGYADIDKVVCIDCIGVKVLKNLVDHQSHNEVCDYCNRSGKCVSVEMLVGAIMDGIRFEYSRAVDELGWCDGEYVGETWDTYDLIHDEIYNELEGLPDSLINDIADTIMDETWCEKDPYGGREAINQGYLWKSFCQMVKTKTRYVFFRQPEINAYGEDANFTILDYITSKIDCLGIIKRLPAETNFYRGRMHNSSIVYKEPKDLCSPPWQIAKANRMSAEGISIFYGSNDVDTVLSEIYDSDYKNATVASFKNVRELTLIDLTKVDQINFPSLFDRKERNKRGAIDFFCEFKRDLVRPIESLTSIEYIPGQILAEYFRFIYKYKGQSFDGIVYNSSKNPTGICYALFFDYEECLENKDSAGCSKEQMLKMDRDSVKVYDVTACIDYKEKRP